MGLWLRHREIELYLIGARINLVPKKYKNSRTTEKNSVV
jgi:hypothetical protein